MRLVRYKGQVGAEKRVGAWGACVGKEWRLRALAHGGWQVNLCCHVEERAARAVAVGWAAWTTWTLKWKKRNGVGEGGVI